MVCLFKKTADCQCRLKFRRTSPGHRRLRFSFQINDFKDPNRSRPAQPFNARSRRRRCLPPLIFRVNQFFLKNFFNTPEARRPRRRRLSKESRTSSQQGFSTFSAKLETEAPPYRSRPARFRTPGPPVSKRAADIRTPTRVHKTRMTDSQKTERTRIVQPLSQAGYPAAI